jgi:hypothetical protein
VGSARLLSLRGDRGVGVGVGVETENGCEKIKAGLLSGAGLIGVELPGLKMSGVALLTLESAAF